MESRKVSIIVPVYNVGQYIEVCLNSILKQTYDNLEIILVDDCSTDDSFSLCQRYAETDARIKLLRNEKNAGVSFSRNRALEVATGDYVSMIDSDDWVEADYIERMVTAIEETDADACVCGYMKEFEDRGKTEHYRITNGTQVKTNVQILNCAMQETVPFVGYILSKLYRKSTLDALELRFDTSIFLCEDSLFNYSYFDSVKNCVLIEECLYHYRIRSQSATRSATPEKHKTRLVAFQKSLLIAQKYPNSVFYYRLNATILNVTMSYINCFFSKGEDLPSGEYKQMMQIAKKAFRETKMKYISKGTFVRYCMLLFFPSLAKFVLRTKEGRRK